MTAPISNGPTTHGYTTMRDATAVLLYEALSQDAPGHKLEHGYVLEQTRGYIGSPGPTKPAECIHHTKSATAM